jgi:hypothetical protein
MRAGARQGFEEHDAERIEVGACIDDTAAELLGGHVGRCPGNHTGLRAKCIAKRGDPEVGELCGPLGSVEEDVVGFDIAMDDFTCMRMGKCSSDIGADPERFRHWQQIWRPCMVSQTLPRDEFHHQVHDALVNSGVQHLDDVRMVQPKPERLFSSE